MKAERKYIVSAYKSRSGATFLTFRTICELVYKH